MSKFGVTRVSDPVFCEACIHGFFPFLVVTPALGRVQEGSTDTLCNDRQVVRVGDSGKADGCCGVGTFLVSSGASRSYVNDRPRARETSKTMHCGAVLNPGTSFGTVTDGFGSPNTFVEAP